jgi:valyl-tRNA synthetase
VNSQNKKYSIDTPPPTVSGHLHMGHVFSYCHADFMARFQRSMGAEVFYPMGFDDNGLPTERLVEKVTGVKVGFNFNDKSREILKILTKEFIGKFLDSSEVEKSKNIALIESIIGIKNPSQSQIENFSGKDYNGICDKEKFIEICKIVVHDAEIEFEKLFKSIDLSVDWNLKYQSISDNSAKIAQKQFTDLFKKGLIYNANAPVYWCCQDKTATANAEIEDKEMTGFQVEFNFHTNDEKRTPLRIMTTRPEMLVACRALLFNPEDERFNGKKTGQKVITKLADGTEIESIGMDLNCKTAIIPELFSTNETVKILPDHEVKMDKGTGLVMCCTYGDWQDVVWSKRHNLGEQIIISDDGKLMAEYAKYEKPDTQKIDYLKVEDARKKAIELLENAGLLLSKKAITHPVKCAERSGKPLEIIPTSQWYVRVLPFKKVLLEMSRMVKFHPESMRIKLENWINGLSQDWCISRNRFFGIQIPEAKIIIYKAARHEGGLLITTEGKEYKLNSEYITRISLQNTFYQFIGNEEVSAIKNQMHSQTDAMKVATLNDAGTEALMINKGIWLDGEKPETLEDGDTYGQFKPSNQVLDTWFTSGLSPQLSGEKNEPMSMRPQAHEIIRTWTFVTLVQSFLANCTEICNRDSEADFDISDTQNYPEIDFKNQDDLMLKTTENTVIKCKKPQEQYLPWLNVMLSGWCLASDKTKMSKSKGNIVTPISLIENFGSDAVRYWSGSSTLGADTAYNESEIKVGSKLVNKIKNSGKFAISVIEKSEISKLEHHEIIAKLNNLENDNDRAICIKASNMLKNFISYFEKYEYSKALEVAEKFFWHDFCDNYLELVKTRSYGIDAEIYVNKDLINEESKAIIEGQSSCAGAIYYCISVILGTFGVFLPKICQDVYFGSILQSKIKFESVENCGFLDKVRNVKVNDNKHSIDTFDKIIKIITEVRKAKSEAKISIKTPIEKVALPKIFGDIINNNAMLDLKNASNCNLFLIDDINDVKIYIG